jgi:hypothetical protein
MKNIFSTFFYTLSSVSFLFFLYALVPSKSMEVYFWRSPLRLNVLLPLMICIILFILGKNLRKK